MKKLLKRMNTRFEGFTRQLRDAVRYCVRWFYFPTLRKLIGPQTSVIGNNCLVGRIYRDLGYPYRTPTTGLFFNYPDYILFLKDLENNLRAPLKFIERSKYADISPHIRSIGYEYPIGVINDTIEIHFLHYPTREIAEEVWRRRAARVNMDDLVVVAEETDMCREEDIREFSRLPFRHKFFFTVNRYDIPDTYFIRKYHKRGDFPNPWRKVLPIYVQMARRIRRQAGC